MADVPKDYLNAILENIVAFWIKITGILGKSKLSQNQEAVDFEPAFQVRVLVPHEGEDLRGGAEALHHPPKEAVVVRDRSPVWRIPRDAHRQGVERLD